MKLLFHCGDYKEFGLGFDAMQLSKNYGRFIEDVSIYLADRSSSFLRNIGRRTRLRGVASQKKTEFFIVMSFVLRKGRGIA